MEIGSFSSIATMVSVVAGVLIYWIRGGNAVTSEVLSAYKLQVEQLKEQVDDLQMQLRVSLDEIGQMKGRMHEKKERVEYLESIVQNRNPELLKILGEIKDFMHQINRHLIKGENNHVALSEKTA